MITAVFFDIDGTLISFETHRVPQSTRNAIELLHQKGIKVFIATGRSFHQITNLEGIHFDGYVTLNGSYCQTDQGEVIFKNIIPRKDIDALVEYMKETPFACTFSTDSGVYINHYNDTVEKVMGMVEIPRFSVMDIEEVRNQEIYQMSAFISEEEAAPILEKVLIHCESTSWHPIFMDIVLKGSSKQAGIDRVLEYYGLNLSDAMCFGDGGNDISMLQHTPISVAMGNATDEVKKYATHVTDSVDDDGVWNALKRLGVI